MRLANKIILASTNKHKLEEFRDIFSAYPGIEIIPANEVLRNADKLPLVEKFSSYSENAIAKARLANHGAHYPCLADDSGLEVEALGGKPGVHSHRYAIAKAGVAQDIANRDKLLSELKGHPMAKRKARFVASLAFIVEGLLVESMGTLEGVLTEAPQGNNGFGYDPLFIPEGYNKTLAEMSEHEKNTISHRARAVHELMIQIKAKGIIFAKP